ncbi:MAG: hypothetical protein AABY83_14565 [Pseudomonadota bacterium]
MLTYHEKHDLAKLLALIMHDDEFIYHADKINDQTVIAVERLIMDFQECNRASAAFLATIKCVPKSSNIYGWILSCLPAITDLWRTHNDIFYTNMLCSTAIIFRKSDIKATLVFGR